MKKISNGIYYINDKIYIAYSDNTISPRIVKNGNPDITSSDYDILIGKNQLPAYSILHTDTQNIVKWEQKGEDPLTHCIPGYYRDNNFTLQDYNRYTEKWNIWNLYLSEYKTKLINIWIFLEGTEQVKTLGFMDFINESNQYLYRNENGTYKDLIQNKNDPDKLYPFFIL